MKKRSTLLTVMSIILIVLGAISSLSSIVIIAMKNTLASTYEAMGIATPSTFSNIMLIIGSIALLVAGILGLMYRSRKAVMVMAIIILLYYIFSLVYNAVTVSFSVFSFISLIIPLLYLWGWYQSN